MDIVDFLKDIQNEFTIKNLCEKMWISSWQLHYRFYGRYDNDDDIQLTKEEMKKLSKHIDKQIKRLIKLKLYLDK